MKGIPAVASVTNMFLFVLDASHRSLSAGLVREHACESFVKAYSPSVYEIEHYVLQWDIYSSQMNCVLTLVGVAEDGAEMLNELGEVSKQ